MTRLRQFMQDAREAIKTPLPGEKWMLLALLCGLLIHKFG